MWVDSEGLLERPEPVEMTSDEIKRKIQQHIQAAENAMEAGFDGVELHGANGYLIKQFLNPHTNRRTDEYGGNIENRSRFLLDVAAGIARAIGKEKVGVRISPFGEFNEMPQYAEAVLAYEYIAKQLNDLGIGYLHISDPQTEGQPHSLALDLRKIFRNTLILSGGYTPAKAEAVLSDNHADLVSFARPFIPNPDLVDRFKNKLPLNQPKFDLFYTAGAEGYVDYPVFEQVQVI
jgi:N-ethylmaleimide reductase